MILCESTLLRADVFAPTARTPPPASGLTATVADPLDNARAKHRQAQRHAELLRADIRDAGEGEPFSIPLVEETDGDGALHLRVGHLVARPEEWGLMFGDAVHNFRSALDNGWWALACEHLSREPNEQEAPQIQFPILRPGREWAPGNHVRWVGKNAVTFAGKLQPDPQGYPPDVVHPLVALNRFSNVDKHRSIHPTIHILERIVFQIRRDDGDPVPLPELPLGTFIHFGNRAPRRRR